MKTMSANGAVVRGVLYVAIGTLSAAAVIDHWTWRTVLGLIVSSLILVRTYIDSSWSDSKASQAPLVSAQATDAPVSAERISEIDVASRPDVVAAGAMKTGE